MVKKKKNDDTHFYGKVTETEGRLKGHLTKAYIKWASNEGRIKRNYAKYLAKRRKYYKSKKR